MFTAVSAECRKSPVGFAILCAPLRSLRFPTLVFLPRIYRQNRPLFWTCVLFIAGSLFTLSFRHVSTPFYVWAMYSTPMPDVEEHGFYVLSVNGDEHYFTPSHSDYRTYFYITSLPLYSALREGRVQPPRFATLSRIARRVGIHPDDFLRRLTPDSSVASAYPHWLRRYVAARLDAPLQRLGVRRISLRYIGAAQVEKVREEVVAAW